MKDTPEPGSLAAFRERGQGHPQDQPASIRPSAFSFKAIGGLKRVGINVDELGLLPAEHLTP